ncbi:MAG: energy transducer TonB [Terracidiphilus sp.]|jgi:TonB family protein
MRKSGLLFVLLALTAGTALAQGELAPSTQDGPVSTISDSDIPRPRPFIDGSYAMSPQMRAPRITQAVPAVYPQADADASALPGSCMLSMVVGADGIPVNIHVVHSTGDALDAAAIEAIKQSKFEPGILRKQPIAVRVRVQFLFSADRSPAIPALLVPMFRNSAGSGDYDKPPVPIHQENAEYSDEARRNRITGVVLISLLVGTDGLPTDLHVVKSVGAGLDEKALDSVSKYRFKPAMKDGNPVPARITVEVSFRLGAR